MTNKFKLIFNPVGNKEDITQLIVKLDKEEDLPIMSGSFAMINDARNQNIKVFKIIEPIKVEQKVSELNILEK